MTKSLLPGTLRTDIFFKNTSIENRPTYRPPQMVSLGCHVIGAALPHPDHTDPESILLGHARRVCFKPPKVNRKTLRRFALFVKQWNQANLIPLPASTDVSIETWLTLTNYPAWRKKELLDTWKLFDGVIDKRHYIVNSFTKDETYPMYKNLRGIQARTDAFKCEVGPYFKAIEKEVFKNDWFIKYVPVPLRPQAIYNKIFADSMDYYATDFTSFEGHFSKAFMNVCEFELYRYMSQNLYGAADFMWYVHNVLGGMNKVKSKFFNYEIQATRQTGEMCTSLGNGYSNLMMILFVCHESGIITQGFVEGDDGIFTVPRGKKLLVQIFEELGFTIKIERCIDLNTASFCGNVFALDSFHQITNPIEAILSFGWTKAIYSKSKNAKLMGLLRSKALSLIYEYGGCPILRSLGLYGLRVTEGYRANAGSTNEYQREQLRNQLNYLKENGLPIFDISDGSRYLVEELYGISVEIQLKFEQYLDSLNEVQPIDGSLVELLFHPDTRHYYYTYVHDVDYKANLDYPNMPDTSNVVWTEDFINKVNESRNAFMNTT